MFGVTSGDIVEPTDMPKPLFVEMMEAYLLIFFNVLYIGLGTFYGYSLYKQNKIRNPQPNGQLITHNSFSLFKRSLYISDCMIIFLYGLPKAIWLLQFEWKYGNIACKVYRYISSVAFFSNSNIICGIALDRYLSVYSNHIIGVRQYHRTIHILVVIWLIAFAAALPQLFLWTTFQPPDHEWEQCVTKFAIASYNLTTVNVTSTAERNSIAFWSILYEGYHQLMAFWLPLSITFGFYVRMLCRLIPFWPFTIINSYEDRHQQTLCTIFWVKLKRRVKRICCIKSMTVRKEDETEQSNSARIPLAGTTRHPPTTALRRQIGTAVFRNAVYIILSHIVFWLPYNFLSLSRFVDEDLYLKISTNGGNLAELLIVFCVFMNPLIYAGGRRNTVHRV